jgi:hypothetical protein
MCLGFLWVDGECKVSVGDFATVGDFGFLDEEDASCALDAICERTITADAMREEDSAPFVGKAAFPPDGCIWALEDLLERALFSSCVRDCGKRSNVVLVACAGGCLG